MSEASRAYARMCKALGSLEMPLAWVDMDRLDENIGEIAARAGDKRIRLASKSLRCRHIIRYILDQKGPFEGLMCFTGQEALWLSEQGFDDLLMGYPIHEEGLLRRICAAVKGGKTIRLMIDSPELAGRTGRIATEEGATLHLCLDADMSTKFPGVHFGVRRSPVREVRGALRVWEAVRQHKSLVLDAFMGYEAQIAGLGDRTPGQGIKNIAIRFMKKRSVARVAARRAEMVAALRKAGAPLSLVNGGGTGSMESTRAEACVTEITVGSGFYASGLFDHYDDFRHGPAAGFALRVVRMPDPGIYTAHGGGYIASGTHGPEKVPYPYLPQGMKLSPHEGAGEVQTPVLYKGPEKLGPGSPLFFRHSKAGELCERFNTLHLIRGDAVVGDALTFRGEGKAFL